MRADVVEAVGRGNTVIPRSGSDVLGVTVTDGVTVGDVCWSVTDEHAVRPTRVTTVTTAIRHRGVTGA
ncbi:MAG: hypothetical protein JWN82_647 [Candidatus Saccharibacteria bacterium]|nr:hypothetical protein [Candidatus Saccharibacteria bacterium]